MTPQSSSKRARLLRQAFNLTPSEWDQILAHQDGVCFICQRPILPPRKPHTDHNHKTGVVRGILCSQCNRALGKVEDPRWQWGYKQLLRASQYLYQPPATEALGRVTVGYPGKIGTFKYRTWLAARENRPKPKRKARNNRDA
jgi:hypothetical protein